MQVTDKMLDAACEAYDLRSGMPLSCERVYMKAAIEAAMVAIWTHTPENDAKGITQADFDKEYMCTFSRGLENDNTII